MDAEPKVGDHTLHTVTLVGHWASDDASAGWATLSVGEVVGWIAVGSSSGFVMWEGTYLQLRSSMEDKTRSERVAPVSVMRRHPRELKDEAG